MSSFGYKIYRQIEENRFPGQVPSLLAGACYSKRSPSDRPRDGSSPFHQRSVNIQDHSIHHRNFEIHDIVVRLSFSEGENRQLLSGCSQIWTIVVVHAVLDIQGSTNEIETLVGGGRIETMISYKTLCDIGFDLVREYH